MDFPKIVEHGELIVKLFNYMDYPRGLPARNVEAFNKTGERVWVIDSLTTDQDTDCYVDIKSDGETLTAFNFMCFECTVDVDNGSIVSSQFTK